MADPETAPADASFQDMDDFMSSAVDALDAGEEIETSESEVSESDIAAVVDAETDSEVEDVEAAPVEDDTETTDEDPADGAEDASEPDESETIAPPQSMSAKDREAFAALPPESQKWLADRAKEQEAAFTQKTMDLAEKSKGFDKLEALLAPRRQQFAMDGMDDSTAIGQLLSISDYANSDPVGFAKYFLNARQIPVSALSETDGQESPVDPQLAAMQQKMQGIEGYLTQQQTQAQRQAESAINSDVQKFSAENEYYAELEDEMVPIVAAVRSRDPSLSNMDVLAKAYKMAIAANETVSAKVEAAKAAKAEADKVAMAKARAAKAKKAASTNTRTTGTRPPANGAAENVDDFIGGLVDERMTA